MITKEDLEECEAWLEASADSSTRNVQPKESFPAAHPHLHGEGAGTGAAESPFQPSITGAAPVPAAPVPGRTERALGNSRAKASHEAHNNLLHTAPMTRADQILELGRMIETLRIVSEETRDKWIEIAALQQQANFPDFMHLDNSTAHLLRLASDLHNHLLDCQCRLQMARMTSRTRPRITKSA